VHGELGAVGHAALARPQGGRIHGVAAGEEAAAAARSIRHAFPLRAGDPRGLAGEAIPLTSRIFAVADVWDALTNDRPYRKAWPADKVIEYIRTNSGLHFDPKVAEVFLEHIDELL